MRSSGNPYKSEASIDEEYLLALIPENIGCSTIVLPLPAQLLRGSPFSGVDGARMRNHLSLKSPGQIEVCHLQNGFLSCMVHILIGSDFRGVFTVPCKPHLHMMMVRIALVEQNQSCKLFTVWHHSW